MNHFNINRAIAMAQLSKLAYQNELTENFKQFSNMVKGVGYDLIKTIHCTETDTQAFLAKNDEHLVIVFRGTCELKRDVLTDIGARFIGGKHEGFLKAFKSIESQFKDGLSVVPNLPIIATGHSLGGALAKVTILEMPSENWQECYTFGSPPICDEATSLLNKVPTHLVVNEGDLVSRILDLHEVSFLDGIYEALISGAEWLVSKIKWDEKTKKQIQQALEYAKGVLVDQKSYCHFGTCTILDRDGMILTAEDSITAFKRVLTSGEPLRVIEDHLIDQYLHNLKAYRDSGFTLKPAEVKVVERKEISELLKLPKNI